VHVSTLATAVMALAIVGVPARNVAAAPQAAAPTAAATIPSDEGVLRGRVVEAGSNRPVAGAQVQALSGSGTFETTADADGRYEIESVTPDSYTVAARANGFVDGYFGQNAGASLGLGAQVVVRGGQATAGVDLALQLAGRISGRILSSTGDGVAGVEVELIPLTPPADAGRGVVAWAQTADDGSYALVDVAPGAYVVRAYLGRDAVGTPGTPSLVYAATFFPGVPERALAQPLRVYAGQEAFDVDFPLSVTKLFTVAGTVIDEQGEPLDGMSVRLVSADPDGGPREGRLAPLDSDGRFVFRDVAPGTYVARLAAPMVSPGPPMPGAMGRAMTTSKTLAVVDADVVDVELSLGAAVVIVGRVVPDLGATATFDAAGVRVSLLRRSDGEGAASFSNSFGMSGTRDGALALPPVASGSAYFDVSTPSGWMVKAMLLDGSVLDDGPVNLAAGRRELEVVLTDRVSGIVGVVHDRSGRPLPNYSVIVFPSDPARWQFSPRTIRAERTDSDGRFQIEALPPGTYQAIAVPTLRRSAQDAAVLERLKGPSESIRVAAGQQLTLSLQASALPDGLEP
jgi:protocatechuate 3,4-dioxygenase beta subunit